MDNTSCAACGKGGDDLKTCTACEAIKYCSVTCQKEHRPNHKKECKKRAAELFDEALFKQPPPREDCPLCYLPLPVENQSMYQVCCGKTVCAGCTYGSVAASNFNCPFCREPAYEDEGMIERIKLRVAANDAEALHQLGCYYLVGSHGLPEDLNKAIELYFRAMELGSIDARVLLAKGYLEGRGVLGKDKKKAKYHLEIAAMAGNEDARYGLGLLENESGNVNRAMKHWTIAATAGHDPSIAQIKKGFQRGHVIKDDYKKALLAYQAYVEETKSENRDKYAAVVRARELRTKE